MKNRVSVILSLSPVILSLPPVILSLPPCHSERSEESHRNKGKPSAEILHFVQNDILIPKLFFTCLNKGGLHDVGGGALVA